MTLRHECESSYDAVKGRFPGNARQRDSSAVHRIRTLWYFAFNMRDPVVGGYTPEERKLRQAISLAFSSQDIYRFVFAGKRHSGAVLHSSRRFWVTIPAIVIPIVEYNVAKAKKLLAEAGYPNGISRKTGDRLTIYFDNYATSAAQRMARADFTRNSMRSAYTWNREATAYPAMV